MNLLITNTNRPTCVIKLLQHLVNSLFYIDIYETLLIEDEFNTDKLDW